MSKRRDKLTDRQEKLLSDLPDDEFVFPGRLQEQSYRKLQRLGFATAELMLKTSNRATGVSEFSSAYKRTPDGKRHTERKDVDV